MIHAADGEIYEKHAEELIRFASGLVGPNDAADVLSSAMHLNPFDLTDPPEADRPDGPDDTLPFA